MSQIQQHTLGSDPLSPIRSQLLKPARAEKSEDFATDSYVFFAITIFRLYPAMFSLTDILSTVRRYWGFSELRPLQEEAIRAGLERRDSLVVMPTGGGKSLCYQV